MSSCHKHHFVNLRDVSRTPFVSTRGDRVYLSAMLWGGKPAEGLNLCCAAAYELGRALVDHSEGLVAGIDRPPYDFRAPGADGRQPAAPAASRAERRSPNRPTGAPGSGE